MRLVSGWRLALRMAWREAWRAKGRTLLVLAMVTFPVVAVVAADIAQATASVSSVEGLDRRIGTAQASIRILHGVDQVFQTADPDSGGYGAQSGHGKQAAPSLAQVEHALGGGTRPAIELRVGKTGIKTQLGALYVGATGVDLRSPLSRGLFELSSGRLPTAPGEVAINAALADEGFAVGDSITEIDGTTLTVVGIAESQDLRTSPMMVGATSLPTSAMTSSWLVGGSPVTWAQVRAVNAIGGLVLSREVVAHPPSTAQLAPQMRPAQSVATDHSIYAVLGLVAAMALLEVVLLAGPAFAVGARRQSRSLALIAANGGTPQQSRRVVLGTAVVIGSFGAVAGVVLGVVLGRALLPVLQSMSSTYFGPFQIRWTHVLGIAAFGLLSAFLAAVVPAWLASRQDVVSVLAGRRGDRAASRRSPFIGGALVAGGVVTAALGTRQGLEALLGLSAILTVFGMIFLVPAVVVGVARLGSGLPLPLRYAVRDAARHRPRTVPAVAAVAATVAGVVALSIGNTSDQAQAKAQYEPQLPHGYSSIAMNSGRTDWAVVEAAVARVAPSATVNRVVGVRGSQALRAQVPGVHLPDGFMSTLPVQALVSDGQAVPELVRQDLSAQEWQEASAMLRRGGVVLFGPRDAKVAHVGLGLGDPGAKGKDGASASVSVPGIVVGIHSAMPRVMGILSPPVARALHLRVQTAGLLLTGSTLTATQSDDLNQVLTGMDRDAYLYTERGYQVTNTEQVVLWILFGLAAVLMIGGTLTATFLALSDARPDLATLSAVGASPVTRRTIAAAYAVSVGVVGAVLGACVGFVPGIGVSYTLTRNFTGAGPSHYLSIPWLEIVGLVVALPVLTALVVGLLARARLPLVARLD